ncbi:hypothetical protein [Novosphingobium sp. Gsoil 351]|uniref:hypothetical protein n=1 Tax=Novosphingobium sp. Gsoil 351 TaxID=2675225 RepID=UPI0012B4EFD5|nr:hypothetical protein [Novosphingobium sp. Gsoil 351]QGN54752.1 hypothetical protein GKE62_09495 [Novosphingobium sp. Gsoil 351]
MRRTIATVLAAATVLSLSVAADAKPRLSPEAKLAKMLDGRVAGKPQDCIFLPSIRGSRIIDKTAIVYDAGHTLWVNRPRNGAESLDDDDIMVTNLHGGGASLCSVDIVQLHDQSSHFYSGFVGLGEFVPYKKVALRD